MNDINKIFKQAMYLLIPPPTHKNEIPTLGIGFSNRELPLTASKLLKLEDVDFILNLHIVGMCVDLVASDSKSSKDVFRAHLNCDLNEVNNFRKVVKNNSKGAFVLGVFENCEFYVLYEGKNFEPFMVNKIQFIEN
ncbi:hypothetical protein [Sphingobacterium multivorum]|uniref:hypothetical protein n=1 Tax=Sphingobacterium TaxID=28453 RepID=UPI00196171A3|nr:hypothetical protein [Sphingobacterium multivorum]QRQ61108.1 hypothetical protein I6J33_23915 [Sphingobacterium multivorum]